MCVTHARALYERSTLTLHPHIAFALSVQGMLDHADKSGKGEVSLDDFYRIMKKKNDSSLDDMLGDDY